MRRRAIADLTQLSDDLFFKEIAQGLRYVLIEEQPPTTMRLSPRMPMEISIPLPGSGTPGRRALSSTVPYRIPVFSQIA